MEQKLFKSFVFFYLFLFVHCDDFPIPESDQLTSPWFTLMNDKLLEFNKESAIITWNLMIGNDPNGTLQEEGAALGIAKTYWKNQVCDSLFDRNFQNEIENRMIWLLCRGPKYSFQQAREISQLLDNMSEEYSSTEICVSKNSWLVNKLKMKSIDGRICLRGEPDLENLMSRQDLDPMQLFWIWKSWHDSVGPAIKQYYPRLVTVLNQAAVNNGYKDIGEVWREELETPNLEQIVKQMYNDVEPLYKMLHGVVRHGLVKKYGSSVVDPFGPIPAHLLGNMWAQDWSALSHLFVKHHDLNLNRQIGLKNWTVKDMVMVAEDMYISLSLPKMTDKFWKYSKFEKNDKNSTLCHGTAANMFNEDDFRILLCAKKNMEDFYVIHHEMGHIEYYMAYKNQPAVFQEGANSAFQESIGDAIMTGVMVPQHLYRIGLITHEQLTDTDFDNLLLFQQALAKIPQIPFALLIDLYRWDIFRGTISPNDYNKAFWDMSKKIRGIVSPEPRSELYFDAGAKFHVPDNTPYIRYFLSAILQMNIFQRICEIHLFGPNSKNEKTDIPFPLHKCDIYGGKKAGIHLKKMMYLGASKNWKEALKMLTGKEYISVKPLLEYYKPIFNWLQEYIIINNVTIGW